MGNYEAADTKVARVELEDAMHKWHGGDEATHTRTLTALRTKFHRLRDRDAEVEAAVRLQLEPSELVEAAKDVLAALGTDDKIEPLGVRVQGSVSSLRKALDER